MDNNIYNKYLNRTVFLITKRQIFYNGIITEINPTKEKLTILDRKLGEVTLSYYVIDTVEPREAHDG